MAKEVVRIPFAEFAANPAGVFDRVVAGNEPVLVEKPDGARAVLTPAPSHKARRRSRILTAADYAAFRSAAGAWADVDTDKFLEDIYADRRASDRPPVEL